ncbi:MAG: hypothetical protein M1812_003210 [Candelaria pacifica]|nr:MAG: hypothetical protein M1812_003210 [Candelaria pacifica]
MAENILREPIPTTEREAAPISQANGHKSAKSTDSMVTVRLSDFESIREHSPPQVPTQPITIHDETIVQVSDTDTADVPLPLKETLHPLPSTAPLHVETEIDPHSGSFGSGSSIEGVLPEIMAFDTPITNLRSRTNSLGTALSDESTNVDWDELERSEVQEPRDEASDESTAFLLARLEQENQALVTDPKSGLIAARKRCQSRPPSIHQIKKLVSSPTTSSLRYSTLPSPPPMTELEFWAALVMDYAQTAQRLPTLTSKKIRGGVPPPLRGVVWQSLAASRDQFLEERFEKLSTETSPYENLIGKDIGRTFPTVEMFRDPDGEGQRMLGRVLKCFSLYDQKIGYCQGLGFLVGPLLLHMGEREAFCVLVRLMEQYDLRSCFTPDLSGLHLRIYQFTHLLAQHLPNLSAHLENLQIEPLYLSQWFLSFFAVTCPLPMLLRIYDVIFAEGASETLMRTALSLMRRNEKKIIGCSELEDVMQLLLSRGLWDCYGCNADDLVNDFVGLTGLVTHDGLKTLEESFQEAQHEGSTAKASSLPNLQATASRFLGRFWAGSHSASKSVTLSPSLPTPSRPISFLRRSPSKQSLASTLNSCEGGSESGVSTVPTEATTMSRQASADYSTIKPTSGSAASAVPIARKIPLNKDKDLHGQIEDLLTALNEMQRDQAIIRNELQMEREQREEDRECIGLFVRQVKETTAPNAVEEADHIGTKQSHNSSAIDSSTVYAQISKSEFQGLLTAIEGRFVDNGAAGRPTTLQTRRQLCGELECAKEQHGYDTIMMGDLNRKLGEQSRENLQLKEQLKEARSRIQESYNEKQRKDKANQELRLRKASTTPHSQVEVSAIQNDVAADALTTVPGGLRDFKLGRFDAPQTQATPTFSKRTSSLSTQAILATANHQPASEDTLLVELVNAKTAEAVAKQELEEMRGKLDSLRKMCGVSGRAVNGHRPSPSEPNNERGITLGTLTTNTGGGPAKGPMSSSVTPPSSATGSFWAGWGKRSTSSTTSPDAR